MKKFSQALVWLTFSEIIYNLSGLVVHFAMGRILGPEQYGRFGLVITLTTMIIILIGNGIPTAMSKYLSEIIDTAPEKIYGIKRSALKLQMILMGIVTVVFFLLAPIFSWLLHDPSLTPLFQLSSLIIPTFAAASFYFYYFTGLHFFRMQAILKSLRAFARIGFIVLLAYYFSVPGAISGYILAPLTVFVVALLCDGWLTKKYFPIAHTHKTTSLFSITTLFQYAWPLTLFLLFYESILTLDLYFVKSLLQSDYLTGIYNAAITAGRIPYYLFYALAIILLPAISKTTAERNTAETEKLVNTSLRLMTLLLFPLVTLLIIYAPYILTLFYGASYVTATQPMSIFAIGVGCITIFYVLSFALNGAGLVKIPMKLTLFGLVGMIFLNFLLIPTLELIGAALATTIVSFILMIGILIAIKRHFNVQIPLKTVFWSCISVAIIIVIARLLPQGTYSFIASGTLLFFAYFGLLKIFGELRQEDYQPFIRLFTKS
ncbi:MAG TPA: flippase [Patescibacteria group bacterium]|nr:flippase [Patescibacteria group bacterium]